MIEILFLCLVIWIIYAWKTGKFSNEYQEKNNAEFKKAWNELKQSFKPKTKVPSLLDSYEPHYFLNKKQRKKLKKEREKHAETLAKKFNTRSLVQDEKLKEQAKQDYEYTLRLRNKSKFDTNLYNSPDDLPDIPSYRYVIEYKNGKGNETVRGIDILAVHKHSNNRWYFLADTDEGERTFKSQRVIRLKDQWSQQIFATSKNIRKHLLSEYDVIEDDFFDEY